MVQNNKKITPKKLWELTYHGSFIMRESLPVIQNYVKTQFPECGDMGDVGFVAIPV